MLEFFFVSPMVMPTIVLAIGLYLLFARFKLVGQPLALYLAHTVVAAPLVIVIVSPRSPLTKPSSTNPPPAPPSASASSGPRP